MSARLKRSGRRKRTHKLILNGKEVTEAEFHRDGPIGGKGVPMVSRAYGAGKELASLSLSCHRDCAAEYNAKAKGLGLTGIKWDAEGDCTITSRQDRAAWLRSQQQHDDDGGYGDG
jgi:hypothetical protein